MNKTMYTILCNSKILISTYLEGIIKWGICEFYGNKATKESAQLKWVVCQNFIVTNLTQIEINIFKDFYCIVEIYQMLEIESSLNFT